MANVAYPNVLNIITLDGTDQIITLPIQKQGGILPVNIEVLSGTGVQMSLNEAIGAQHFVRPATASFNKATFSMAMNVNPDVLHLKGTVGDKVLITY